VTARVVTRQFVVLITASFAVFTSFGVYLLALPLYVRDGLGASDAAVGVAFGIGSVGAVLAGPPAGRIADRVGRIAVLLAGAVIMVAGYAVLAMTPPLEVVVAIRLLAGVGEAAFVVAAFTMVADAAPPERRGEAISLFTVGSYGGLALGPVLANVLLDDDRFGLVFLVAVALAVLAAMIVPLLAETRPASEEAAPRGFLPPRSALMPGLVLLLALLGFGGFNAFAALHAREVGLERPGVVFAVFGATIIAVRLFGRRLPDRLGPRRAATLACLLVAVGLVTISAWTTEAGLLVGTAVFGSGQALAYPAIALLAISRAAPAERSAAVGSVAAFVDVALGVGAFVLGAVAEAQGYPGVFLAGAVSAAIGLLLLARLQTWRVGAEAV
jgi:MFS family permease